MQGCSAYVALQALHLSDERGEGDHQLIEESVVSLA
jgi:hypothetical protein